MKTKHLLNDIAQKSIENLKEIYNLKKEIGYITDENQELKAQLHAANNSLQRSVIEAHKLNKQNEVLEQNFSQLENANQQLKSNLEKLNTELSELKIERDKIKQLLEETETKNADLQNELESAQKVIKEDILEIQRLNDLFEQKKRSVIKKIKKGT